MSSPNKSQNSPSRNTRSASKRQHPPPNDSTAKSAEESNVHVVQSNNSMNLVLSDNHHNNSISSSSNIDNLESKDSNSIPMDLDNKTTRTSKRSHNSEDTTTDNTKSNKKSKQNQEAKIDIAQLIVKKTKYTRWVNVLNCYPGANIREVHPHGVESMKHSLKQGYIPTLPILVTENESSQQVANTAASSAIDTALLQANTTDKSQIDTGTIYSVIEGMHRVRAWQELCKDNIKPHPFMYATVLHDLTRLEQILIASHCNNASECIVKSTTLDKFTLLDAICENLTEKEKKKLTAPIVWSRIIEEFGNEAASPFGQWNTFRTLYFCYESLKDKKLREFLQADFDKYPNMPTFSLNFLQHNFFKKKESTVEIKMLFLRRFEHIANQKREVRKKSKAVDETPIRFTHPELDTASIALPLALEQWNLVEKEISKRTKSAKQKHATLSARQTKQKNEIEENLLVKGEFDSILLNKKNDSKRILTKIQEVLDADFTLEPPKSASPVECENEDDGVMVDDGSIDTEPSSSQSSASSSGKSTSSAGESIKNFESTSQASANTNTNSQQSLNESMNKLQVQVNIAILEQEKLEQEKKFIEENTGKFAQRFKVENGDCIAWMKDESNKKNFKGSIQLILTDPPFNILKDEKTKLRPDDYINENNMKEFVTESYHYLSDDGTAIIYCHFLQVAMWWNLFEVDKRWVLERNPVYVALGPNQLQKTKRTYNLQNVVYMAVIAHKSREYYRELDSKSPATVDSLREKFKYPSWCNLLPGVSKPTNYLRFPVDSNNNNGDIKDNSCENDLDSPIEIDEDEIIAMEIDSENNNPNPKQKQVKPPPVRIQEKSSDFWRIFIKAYTKPDSWILDPYAGTMSLGLDCIKYGRKYIGIEVDTNCYKLAVERLFSTYMEAQRASIIEQQSQSNSNKKKSPGSSNNIPFTCKDCLLTEEIKAGTKRLGSNDLESEVCSEDCLKGILLKREIVKELSALHPEIPRSSNSFLLYNSPPYATVRIVETHPVFKDLNLKAKDMYINPPKSFTREQLNALWQAEQQHCGNKLQVADDDVHRYGCQSLIEAAKGSYMGVVYGSFVSRVDEMNILKQHEKFNQEHKHDNDFYETEKTAKFMVSELEYGGDTNLAALKMHDYCQQGQINSSMDAYTKKNNKDRENACWIRHPSTNNSQFIAWFKKEGFAPAACSLCKLTKPITPTEFLYIKYPYYHSKTGEHIMTAAQFKESTDELGLNASDDDDLNDEDYMDTRNSSTSNAIA
jgi:DNA modification methylase